MSQQPPLQELEGTVERITYQNEENGYTVAKIQPKGKRYEITAVGTLSGVQVGESVRLRGFWTTHPEYGRQFEVRSYTVRLPATIEGIRKYLGSGLIKGIGPVMAERIVAHFGKETLNVIEQAPERLLEVPGIGRKRVARIKQAWQEQQRIKEIMLFLQAHGVSTGLAVKIYKQYEDEAIAILRSDPYRLARDIYGIGFKTADAIAQKLGLPPDAPQRIEAGLVYTLSHFADDGHCFATREDLVATASTLLEVPPDVCEWHLDTLLGNETLIADGDAIYLPPFYYAEVGVARKLHLLMQSRHDRLGDFAAADWTRIFAWLDRQSPFPLAPEQQQAVRMAFTQRVSILTGGPGTGKSTVTGAIIRLLQAKGRSVLLAAPTGRAAKRLSEATGLPAQTIHRLLEFKPSAGNLFLRDRENPLDADMIIVDEASMIDILLMNHLLKAIPAGAHLLIIGDIDQLPSVGPGNVLRDLIESEQIPVTRLKTIFRQEADSYIIVNAHRINNGEMPIFARNSRDFFFFNQPEPEPAADLVLDIVARRIPQKFGYNPLTDVQVLSPMHRGAVGVGELNRRLQERLNPARAGVPEYRHGHRTFRIGDRIMQIRNNYEKRVFNGDMGRITQIDLEEQRLIADFDGDPIEYEFHELDQIVHAYAISVHKSQGSEFPVIVMPVLTQHYMMLQRNLLYTGITRAREMVVLVGSKRAIAIAVRNNRVAQRNTRLAHRLRDTPTLDTLLDVYA
ncbi:exodeoxyribonuclease V alpha subunit [Ardenticatena maritima]|uniref:ATP-dependent RecD2 DNA helicase n=1 Tax=Ardenticatena maritima TaxID=872965 RepID=A0A0M8K8P0_9CHLR|nr:ATP-dependent RecD-like DNA helicase [Ardenticatena maritima]KPL87799.1 helicase [Ardenticatena maritima]GAP63091.1 exodeoxyribonuclease V alpha subunit [Ardenticatena maritima]